VLRRQGNPALLMRLEAMLAKQNKK